jgi:hypothetical protein
MLPDLSVHSIALLDHHRRRMHALPGGAGGSPVLRVHSSAVDIPLLGLAGLLGESPGLAQFATAP